MYSWKLSSITVRNSIIWENSAQAGPEIYVDDNVSIEVEYSNVQGGQGNTVVGADCTLDWGTGNVDINPFFLKPGSWDGDTWIAGDYHISINSPCIDAGTDAGVYVDLCLSKDPLRKASASKLSQKLLSGLASPMFNSTCLASDWIAGLN